MKKYHTVHQLSRATKGFVKKPNQRYIREQNKKFAQSIREEVANYDNEYYVCDENGKETHVIEKASEKTFGIFNVKGYRAIKLFYSREEAEEELKTWKRPDLYQVREIEWFEEDKEIK